MKENIKNILLVSLFAINSASKTVLEVYNTDFKVDFKEDNSPLTMADKKSHRIITNILMRYFPGIPILSEEGKDVSYIVRRDWEYFWLIDPLDGTKEFIKRNGEFTVNIALVCKDRPILGVIAVPVKNTIYFALKDLGSYKIDNEVLIINEINSYILKEDEANLEESYKRLISYSKKLPVDEYLDNRKKDSVNVIVSRSHMNQETEDFLKELSKKYRNINRINIGSSLKLCTIAEGKADIYPRFAPTMEWDIAAGQCIVEEAGGSVIDYNTGKPMRYNKESLVNPWFVVSLNK